MSRRPKFSQLNIETNMLQRWLLLWLLASSGIAFFWVKLLPGAFDPFVATKPYLNVPIFLAMFAVGCLLRLEEVLAVGRRWPAVIYGTSIQFTAMPLLSYFIGHAFGFDSVTMLGVIMVGCVPGAMASNVLTLAAGGNVSYSVALTTLATMISPIAVPLALWLTLDITKNVNEQFDAIFGAVRFWKTAQALLIQVVLPVLLGFGLCRIWPRFERFAIRFGSHVANLAILWVIAVVVGLNRDRLGSVLGFRDGVLVFGELKLLIALLLINILGYLAGYLGGRVARLNDSMTRAVTLEIGMQNCGLGTALILQLFPGKDYEAAAIPTAAYTFLCVFTATILAHIWSRIPLGAVETPLSAEQNPASLLTQGD